MANTLLPAKKSNAVVFIPVLGPGEGPAGTPRVGPACTPPWPPAWAPAGTPHGAPGNTPPWAAVSAPAGYTEGDRFFSNTMKEMILLVVQYKMQL